MTDAHVMHAIVNTGFTGNPVLIPVTASTRVVLADEASFSTLSLEPLQREMSRVFRSLAIGHGKPKRPHIQAVK